MQYITDVKNLQLHNTAVALGKFDGFHRGHQLLFQQVCNWQKEGLKGIIFTFGRPEQIMEGTGSLFSSLHIDSHEEKLHKAGQTGIDILLEYPFTEEFSSLSPEKFVKRILVEQLHVKAVTVGRDFRFGKNRSGDAALLQELGSLYGFQVVVFDKLRLNGEEISSSSIRHAIQEGDMEFVSEAMGRGYSVYGEVVHGASLGHTIGIPTINQLPSEEKLLPPYGVYAARCHIEDRKYYGIANLGCKPTVSSNRQVGLETHIFDFQGDLYGKQAEVELLQFLRPEMKFNNIEALVEQMQKDMQIVRNEYRIS